MLDVAEVESPVGRCTLIARGDFLVGLDFSDEKERLDAVLLRLQRRLGADDRRSARDPAGAATRLRRYWSGDEAALAEQPVELHGTPFEERVWSELRRIPQGTVISYRELARRLGQPSAVRAVGQANGRNAIALFVPCHRVVAADGGLGGYGGGLDRKRALLQHEGALQPLLG